MVNGKQSNLYKDWGLKDTAKIIAECKRPTRIEHCYENCVAFILCDKPIWKKGQRKL